LPFIGFLFLENKLKKESFESIKILLEFEIEKIMATGDNTVTALAVS
jgi:magnesium-transporting ATPase (P-type)